MVFAPNRVYTSLLRILFGLSPVASPVDIVDEDTTEDEGTHTEHQRRNRRKAERARADPPTTCAIENTGYISV